VHLVLHNLVFTFFVAVVAFSLITLPVEFNASSRAIKILQTNLAMPQEELKGVKSVLGAAAMTYVAATLMAILQLLRMIFIARGRD